MTKGANGVSIPKFHALHYNFVAKRIRDNFPGVYDYGDSRAEYLSVSDAIVRLAIDFAKHFKEDNPAFDPLMFLDACSPNAEELPLSELWEDDEQAS
jgi:hypothetical protein